MTSAATATPTQRTAETSVSPTMPRTPQPPAVANAALAALAKQTDRVDVRICLYVDPQTARDESAALAMLQMTLDALVSSGYASLSATAALCPEAPLFIRTSSVHPKNRAAGRVAPVPRVNIASPWLLWVAVTTATRIESVFGGLTSHRGAEEFTCTGDNCGEVTASAYIESIAFDDPSARSRIVLEGLGLSGR